MGVTSLAFVIGVARVCDCRLKCSLGSVVSFALDHMVGVRRQQRRRRRRRLRSRSRSRSRRSWCAFLLRACLIRPLLPVAFPPLCFLLCRPCPCLAPLPLPHYSCFAREEFQYFVSLTLFFADFKVSLPAVARTCRSPTPLRSSFIRPCGSEPIVENGRQHAVLV